MNANVAWMTVIPPRVSARTQLVASTAHAQMASPELGRLGDVGVSVVQSFTENNERIRNRFFRHLMDPDPIL